MSELDNYLQFAKQLALEAGGIMQRYFRSQELGTVWKEDQTPLTAADTAINKLVIDQVKVNFPKHGVLGEEQSFEPERGEIWVVDPIDGTAPFSLGIPLSTFALALVNRHDGQPVTAVVYDPHLDELFYATKGGGAFLNGRSIKTSRMSDFKNAYFAVNSGNIALMQKLKELGAHLMNIASFCYFSNHVAAGQLLAAIMQSPNAWDVAATSLLVQEAGGVVTDYDGRTLRCYKAPNGTIMAANKAVHQELLKLIRGAK